MAAKLIEEATAYYNDEWEPSLVLLGTAGDSAISVHLRLADGLADGVAAEMLELAAEHVGGELARRSPAALERVIDRLRDRLRDGPP